MHLFFQPEKLGTEWQYLIEWYPGGSSDQRSLVKMTSQPRFGEDDIVVHIWSNSHLSQDIVNSQKPLAIYAQVIKGPSPVLNADVTVTITVTKPDGNGNTFNLRLVDDGSGGMYLLRVLKVLEFESDSDISPCLPNVVSLSPLWTCYETITIV